MLCYVTLDLHDFSSGKPVDLGTCSNSAGYVFVGAFLRLGPSPFLSDLCSSVDEGQIDRLLNHVLFSVCSGPFLSLSSLLTSDSLFLLWQFLTSNSVAVTIFIMV